MGCIASPNPPPPREVRESSPDADLVAVEGARVALDRLAQRADFGLLSSASLARALAAQAAPQRAQLPGSQREIAPRPMDVQPGVGFVGGAREPRHHTADGAHQVTVPGQGLLGWRRMQTAAVAKARRARPKLYGYRRPIGSIQRLVATGEALRAAHGRMVLGGEATGIQRDGPLVDRGHVPEHQPLCDFGRHESVYRVQQRRFGRAGQERGVIAGHVAKEVVDFLVAAQTIRETGPARPLFPPAGRRGRTVAACRSA